MVLPTLKLCCCPNVLIVACQSNCDKCELNKNAAVSCIQCVPGYSFVHGLPCSGESHFKVSIFQYLIVFFVFYLLSLVTKVGVELQN